MRWRLRLARLTGWSFVALFGLFGLLHTPLGLQGLAVLVSAAASTEGSTLKVTGIRGAFPTDLTIQRLDLADRQGVWLRVEGAHLDWSLASLFDGRLRVDTLAARRVELLRRPEPAPSDRSYKLPLVGIDLRVVSIDELQLASAIGGLDSRWRVGGEALLARDLPDSRLRLSMQRIDGPAGELTADIRFDRGRALAQAEIALEEPTSGGVAAALLGRPDLEAVSFRLAVKGDADAGTAELTLDAGDAVTARGGAGWHRGAGITTASLRLKAVASNLPDGPLARLFATPVTLKGSATLNDAGVTLHAATLDSAAGQIAVTGQYDFAGDRLEVAAIVESDETGALGALLGGASWRDLHLGLRAAIANLSAQPRGTIDFTATADDVVPAHAPMPPLGRVDASGQFTLRDGRLRIERLDAASSLASLKVTGEVLPAVRLGDLNLTVAVADLAPFSALAGFALQGRGGFELAVRARPEGTQAQWHGKLLDAGIAGIATNVLPTPLRLTGSAAVRRDGDWRLQSFQVAGAFAELDITGRGRGRVGELDLSLALPRLAALGIAFDGSATVSGRILHQPDGVMSARLASSGELAGQPISLSGWVVRDVDGGISIPALTAKWASASLDVADFSVGPTGTAGTARLHVSQIRDLALLIGADLAGTLDVDIATDLRAPDDKLRARLAGRNLRGFGDVDRLIATVTSDLRGAELALRAAGPRTAVTLAAGAQPVDGGMSIVLNRLEGRHGDVPFALAGPADARLMGSRIAIDPTTFRFGNGHVIVGGIVDPLANDLALDVSAVPLEALGLFAPDARVDGILQARLRVRGGLTTPSVEGTYAASGVRLRRPEMAFLPSLSVTGTTFVASRQAAFDAKVSGPATALAGKGTATLPRGAATLVASARVTGTTDLALLQTTTTTDVRGLGGRLLPDLAIEVADGTVRGNGTIGLTGATLSLPDSGLRVDRGEGWFSLRGETLLIERLRFQTAAGAEPTPFEMLLLTQALAEVTGASRATGVQLSATMVDH